MLLDRYKNTSPTPSKNWIRTQTGVCKIQCRHWLIYKLKAVVFAFFIGCGVIFTIHNIIEYNRSFDRCEELLKQIHANTALLEQEINQLRVQMGEVVDYE